MAAGNGWKGQIPEALDAVRSYTGTFEFMLVMQSKAQDPYWTPTARQVQAIAQCEVAAS